MTLLDELRERLQATYRIDRELGGGGMSRVFVAEEIGLQRRIVLKVLSAELAHSLSAERFEREMRVAAGLQHPHVVPLLAAGRTGDLLYYTMPLVEGESLRSRLDAQGELPVADAVRLFREVADALAYAHRRGVVHRDIKPDNILLSHDHAMVTDFGVARAVSEAASAGTLTQTGMAVGTPAYMAPEQAAAAPTDHRADVYALGLVAYEMLAGHSPFRGSTPQALIAAHMTQAPPPLAVSRPAIPAALAAIVHRCLEKRAADRFQTAEELVATLDRLPLVSAASTPAGEPTLSRRALLAGGAALGLLAIGAGGGAWAALRARPRTLPSYQRLTFRRGMIRTARFSADERTILYGALWGGDVARVYTVRTDGPESSALNIPPATPLAVSTSGELALALGTHYRGIMTYGTLARLPLAGGAPRELQEHVKFADWSPDGRDLAIVRRVADSDHLEFPIGTTIAQPDSPRGGFSFARVSPRGDAVAAFELTNRQQLVGRVVIVDRSGAKRMASQPYANVFGLAWNGDEVWFTAADQLPLFRNTIHAMNRAGDVRIVARVPGNTSLHDIAPSGRMLVARTDDRTGVTVRAPGDAIERDFSWLDASNVADLSRDGRQVLFFENGVAGGPNGSTYLRNVDGSPAVRLGDGRGQSISADGRWVIVGHEGPSLEVIPTGPGEAYRLARPGLTLREAQWHPDGRRVVAIGVPDGGNVARLYVLDATGDAMHAATPEGLHVPDGEWALAPDGSRLAVSTPRGVELFALAGGAAMRLPESTSTWRVVGWIDRGVLIADEQSVAGAIFRVDPESGQGTPWADIKPQDAAGIMNLDLGSLVTTPDGHGYGYTWHRALSDLYLVDDLR